MNHLNRLFAAATLLLSGAVVAACTAVVVEERPPTRPGAPQMCTMQYDPVCGERRGSRQTFGNACEADRAGYRIVHPGECRRGGWAGPGTAPPDRPQFCTREYAPVCATRGGSRQTFGNSCEAEAAGYRIIRDGRC